MSVRIACPKHLLMYDVSAINPVDLQWISS